MPTTLYGPYQNNITPEQVKLQASFGNPKQATSIGLEKRGFIPIGEFLQGYERAKADFGNDLKAEDFAEMAKKQGFEVEHYNDWLRAKAKSFYEQKKRNSLLQKVKNFGGGLLGEVPDAITNTAEAVMKGGQAIGKGFDTLDRKIFGMDSKSSVLSDEVIKNSDKLGSQLEGGIRKKFDADPESGYTKAGEVVTDIASTFIGGPKIPKGVDKIDDALAIIANSGDDIVAKLGLSKSLGQKLVAKIGEYMSKNPVKASIAKGVVEGVKDTAIYDAVANSEIASKEELGVGGFIGGIVAPVANYIGSLFKDGSKKLGALRIDDQTKTALNTSSIDQIDEYVKATKLAKSDVAMPTAYEVAARKAEDALAIIDDKLKNIGSQIGNIRTSNGTTVITDPGDLIGAWNKILQNKAKVSIQLGDDGLFTIARKGKVNTLPGDESRILQDFVDQLNEINKSGRLEVQDLVDLNTFINQNYNKVEKASNSFKSIVTEIKKQTNDLLYSMLPDEYSPLMREYSDLLSVDENIQRFYGEFGERGSTMIRSIFGSNAMRTRETLQKIKDITGVDLFKEGQLAKFVIDALGDKRGLEQILNGIGSGPISALSNVVSVIKDATSNPIKGAKYLIKGGSNVKVPGILTRKAGAVVSTNDK